MAVNHNNILKISNVKLFEYSETDIINISPKTFNRFLCLRDKHVIKKILLFNENYGYDKCFMDKIILNQGDRYINKIILNNKYLFLSNSNILYKINDDNHKKIFNLNNNSLKSIFNNEAIRYLISLDNKNIEDNVEESKISFYNYVNSKYEKFFNNLNKYGQICGLLKLDNNEFCFLSTIKYNNSDLIISKFNEDFYSVEKILNNITCNMNDISNLIFKISKDYIVIVGSDNFAIFNLKQFEINTLIETDKIISSLNINIKNLDSDEYEYMALITRKEKNYNLQIYKFDENSIKGVKEISLIECFVEESSDLDLDEDNGEKGDNKEEIQILLLNSENITDFFKNSNYYDLFQNNKSFDIHYDIGNNGNIILIIGINFFSLNKRLVALFEVNLDNLEYK